MVGILARDAVLDPLENVLAAEEHALFGDWRPCDVRIDYFVQGPSHETDEDRFALFSHIYLPITSEIKLVFYFICITR